jgi:hypothetical protein
VDARGEWHAKDAVGPMMYSGLVFDSDC